MIDKSRFSISHLIDKVLSERVLARLSEEEREALKDDFRLVRELIGEQRTPRIAVVGPQDVSLPGVVKTIMGESIDGDPTVKERLGKRRWYDYDSPRGVLRLLDLRADLGAEDDGTPTIQAISREEPDIILFLWRQGDAELVEHLERIVKLAQGTYGETPATVAALIPPQEGDFDEGEAESELRRLLVDSAVPNESFDVVLWREEQIVVDRVVHRAPLQVRVRLAHLTWVRETKRDVAESVVRAASGITGAIATVPIPVADILPITGLQMSMIAVVAHISGREMSLKNAWEFGLGMGLNVGVGLALRSVARTAVRFIPLAGSVIAAGIASSATYTLGQGAISYFIGERR